MKSYEGLIKDYWLFWFASSLGMGASNILQYVLSLYPEPSAKLKKLTFSIENRLLLCYYLVSGN